MLHDIRRCLDMDGVAAGLVWIISGMIGLTNSLADRGFERDMTQIGLASVLCLVLFLALAHKRRFRFAWAPPIVILLSVVLGPIVCDQFRPHEPSYGQFVTSLDGAFTVYQSGWVRGRSILLYTDQRAGTQSLESFDGVAIPMAVDDRGRAYLLQSLDNRRLRVLEWDGKKTSQVANIPGPRRLLDSSRRYWSLFGSVSQDHRYLLFTTGSMLGSGADCWLVNLRSGEAWIAIPNHNAGISQATWLKGRVVLSASWSGLQVVDLRTQRTSPMRIPSGTEDSAR